jgi:hypothetical protein
MAAARHRTSSRGWFGAASRGMRIATSHALMFRTKLLLLNAANHIYRRTRSRKALKRVQHFRFELHRAEAALRRSELYELPLENGDFWLRIYADLIDCAAAALHRMGPAMSSPDAADRFETATDVQMLEELIAQWTSRMELIRQTNAAADATRSET